MSRPGRADGSDSAILKRERRFYMTRVAAAERRIGTSKTQVGNGMIGPVEPWIIMKEKHIFRLGNCLPWNESLRY